MWPEPEAAQNNEPDLEPDTLPRQLGSNSKTFRRKEISYGCFRLCLFREVECVIRLWKKFFEEEIHSVHLLEDTHSSVTNSTQSPLIETFLVTSPFKSYKKVMTKKCDFSWIFVESKVSTLPKASLVRLFSLHESHSLKFWSMFWLWSFVSLPHWFYSLTLSAFSWSSNQIMILIRRQGFLSYYEGVNRLPGPGVWWQITNTWLGLLKAGRWTHSWSCVKLLSVPLQMFLFLPQGTWKHHFACLVQSLKWWSICVQDLLWGILVVVHSNHRSLFFCFCFLFWLGR